MSKTNPLEYIEKIYIEHYPYLRNFLLGMTKSDTVADDIIQELFSKILTDPTSVLKVTYMKSWLVKGAKNTLLDYYKKKKPELFRDENVIETLLIDNYSPEINIMVNYQIENILSRLSSTDKAIILAKEYYGYSYLEISELFNLSIPALKSKVFRIRKRIIKER